MTRLGLLILFGLAVSYYFPDSRQVLVDALEPVRNRLEMWATREEMSLLGEAVVEHERLTGDVPDRRDWVRWLNWRYPQDAAKQDPWGALYQVQVWADSLAIISYGPDGERGSEDDFQVVTLRERRR